jgi:hypothetical protein
MALARRFEEVSTCHTIKIGSLDTDWSYPITRPERVGMRYGPAVLLPIRESYFSVKMFLPRRYCEVVTDEEIASINSETNNFYLIYRGCVRRHVVTS